MGTKEDLVRARLSKEAREREERERMTAEHQATQTAKAKQEYHQLIADIDEAATHVAGLLENADWSKAALETFISSKTRRWKPRERVEYACLSFGQARGDGFRLTLWMRSDGVLYVQDVNGSSLVRPSLQWRFNFHDWRFSDLKKDLDVILKYLWSYELSAVLARKLP